MIPRHLCFKGQNEPLPHSELISRPGSLPQGLKSSITQRELQRLIPRGLASKHNMLQRIFPSHLPPHPPSCSRPSQPPSFTCLNLKSKSQTGRGIVTSNCNIPQEFVWELKGAKPGPSPKLASLSFLRTTFDLFQYVECKRLSCACLAALGDSAGLLWPTMATCVTSPRRGQCGGLPAMSHRPPELALIF